MRYYSGETVLPHLKIYWLPYPLYRNLATTSTDAVMAETGNTYRSRARRCRALALFSYIDSDMIFSYLRTTWYNGKWFYMSRARINIRINPLVPTLHAVGIDLQTTFHEKVLNLTVLFFW